jgi:alkylated DNA repair dioxygenase AlkB
MLKKLSPQTFAMPDADVVLYKQLFDRQESENLFVELREQIEWNREAVKIMGKLLLPSRMTAYYGDKPYRYSGITRQPLPWISPLLAIKSIIEPIIGIEFNAVLLNLYQDGNDGMGWHSDDERDLAANSVIASVSFGESKRFMFRRKDDHELKVEMKLEDGDLLIMQGTTQKFWQHQVPKTSKKTANEIKPRINLTYRVMV